MRTHEAFVNKLLQQPETKAEYEAQAEEFALLDGLLDISKETTMSLHHGIQFEFFHADDGGSISTGSVIVRDGEMVLEVECPGDRPYSIRGKLRDGFFEGVHEGLVGDDPVHAKWTRLDDLWIGTWEEADQDCLFTFRFDK